MGLAPAQDSTVTSVSNLFPFNPKRYLLGHYWADTSAAFSQLPESITGGRRILLRREAADALGSMIAAGENARVNLVALSGARSFASQRSIWNAKYSGRRMSQGRNLAQEIADDSTRVDAILRYSSAPGTSRHHWGTEIDLTSTSLRWWKSKDGQQTLAWLKKHAAEYGYFMAYSHGRQHGYKYEPWHWSYMPLSKPMLTEYYGKYVSSIDITGFDGSEFIRKIKWREWYVEGVNTNLK